MDYLVEATIFLLAAVVAVPVFRWLGLGAVLGYLAAGLLLGPSVVGVVDDVDSILQFAKIGVVLLLFLVGLELSPHRLWVMRRDIFGIGFLGVTACAVPLAVGAALLADLPWPAALVVGAGLGFSSTAFAMQALSERSELNTAHGRGAFAMLLFKYLALLPLLAALPLLGDEGGGMAPGEVALGIARTVAVVALVVVGGHYVLRPVFRLVARLGARETFTATALLVVLGTSVLLDLSGLPMELGAFLAGVLLADSEYRHEVHVAIEPFKGLLLGLFFIAVGMSADLRLLGDFPGVILGATAAVVVFKLITVYATGRLLGFRPLAARRLAAVMPQGGELAFVLFSMAAVYGVMGQTAADVLVAVVTLTMALTPVVLFLERTLPDGGGAEGAPAYDDPAPGEASPPVLICGFGRFGQIVARLLHSAGIPFAALDVNPEQVDVLRRYGHRVHYGDPSRVDLLRAAGAADARAIVVAVDDVRASIRTVEHIRRHFPRVPVYARARNRQHAWRLMDLDCHVIVREVLSGSLDMGRELLRACGWRQDDADAEVMRFRDHDASELQRHHAVHQEEGSLCPVERSVQDELEGLLTADGADAAGGEGGSPAGGRRRGA